ncbi:TIGR00270 family protein [Candidatus Woesearchaeota archaeon]|nr:MAG: TIGR00270 family protein [Candidatus Woesearchaeota archaeon]
MPTCELCGKKAELVTAIIENTEMNVCKQCSKYGKIIKKPKQAKKIKEQKEKTKEKPEIIETIATDYSQKIRNTREKLGLTQKEFAEKLHEKESIIQKMETGHFTPSLSTARKLEKALKIKLIEEIEDKAQTTKKREKKELTIGDIIKIKH